MVPETILMTVQVLLPEQQLLVDQVEKALAEIRSGSNSKGILVSGPSGTGKTTAMDLIAESRPPRLDGVQRCVPCCRISAMSQGDTKSVAQSILNQLGMPFSATRKFTNSALEDQVPRALIACDVQILMLEEMNNALLASSKDLRGKLSRFLKNLWNLYPDNDSRSWAQPSAVRQDKRLVIIVSGTEDLRPVFDRDKELASRFSCRINPRPLWFDSKESLKYFRKVFQSLVVRFHLEDAIGTPDVSLLARSLFACNAHLRNLDSLLQRAEILLEFGHSSASGEALLSSAFEEVLRSEGSHPNPFLWTDDQLRQRIAVERERLKVA